MKTNTESPAPAAVYRGYILPPSPEDASAAEVERRIARWQATPKYERRKIIRQLMAKEAKERAALQRQAQEETE